MEKEGSLNHVQVARSKRSKEMSQGDDANMAKVPKQLPRSVHN